MSEVQIVDGKVLIVDGGVAVDEACCCTDCNSSDSGCTFTIGDGEWPGVFCQTCDFPNIYTDGLFGPIYWDITSTGADGWSHEIFSKPGFADCQICLPDNPDFDWTGYVSRGGLGPGQTFLRIERTEPTICDEFNDRCWIIVSTHVSGTVCYSCPQGVHDQSTCNNCCSIAITAPDFTCTPLGGGDAGVGAVFASFVITIPTYGTMPDCPDFLGDGSTITWEIIANGISLATGTGLTGSGTGAISCACPSPTPCALTPEVTVNWCVGEYCCSGSN